MSDGAKLLVESARCPDCGEMIRLKGKVHIGREIVCPHCDALLEVILTEPVELDWIYEDEDEDDEDED